MKALKAGLKPQATACRDGRWQANPQMFLRNPQTLTKTLTH